MTTSTDNKINEKPDDNLLVLSAEGIRSVFNSISDGIAVTDVNQIITRINSSLLQMCGYKEQESLIGRSIWDMIDHADIARVKKSLAEITISSGYNHTECCLLKNDFSRNAVDITINKLDSGANGINGYIFICKERSEAILAEEVQMAEQNYRRSLDDSPLGILIVDSNFDIQYANKSMLDIHDVSNFEDLVNTDLLDMMTPASFAEHMVRMDKRANGEPMPHSYEMSIVTSKGETKYLMVFRRVVVWNGEIAYQLAFFDISINKEALEMHTALADNAPTSVYIVQDGKICYTNQKFLKTCGYSSDEIVDMRIDDLVYEPDKDYVKNKAMQMMRGKEVLPYEFRFVDKQGNIKWAMESVSSVYYRGKRAVVGNISDITEHKKAIENLNYSDAALKSIHEGVYMMDNDFVVTRWNAICENMFGISASEAIGNHISSVLELVEDYPGHNQDRVDLLFSQRYNKEEQLLKSKKGYIWLEVYAQEIKLHDEQQGWITILSDISERKRMERELKDSEEYLRSLITSMDDIVFTYDLEGKFSDFYKASVSVENYIEQNQMQFIGKHYRDVLPEDVSDVMDVAFSETCRTGENTKFEYSIDININVNPGQLRWYDARVSPIRDANDAMIGVLVVSRDITERVRIEKALLNSEQRVRSILNAMDDLFFTYDLNGKFTDFYKITSYPEEEPDPRNFVGKSFRDFLPTSVADKIELAMKAVLSTGENQQFDYCMPVAGEDRWFDARVSPIRDDQQEISGILVISREITERILVEFALAESEEKMRSLITSMDDTVFSFDLNGSFTHFYQPYHNQNMLVKNEHLIGNNYHDVLPKEISEKLEIALQDLVTTGENQQFDCWTKPVNEWLCLNAKISPVLDRKGSVTGITVVTRDITNRKHMEDQIVEAAREWEATFDSLTESIYIIDPSYNIIKANRAYSESVGLNMDDIIGKTCYSQLYHRNTPCADCPVAEVLDTNKQVFSEVKVKDKEKYLQIVTSPIFDHEGNISSLITSARDVSELKKIEVQFQQSQLLASLGTMTAGIAHEVNNPLGSVLLLSELLLKDSGDESIKKDLRVIHSEAKRAAKIMSTLLTYRNRSITNNRRLNISRIMKKVMSIRQYRQNVLNIESMINVPDMPLYVRGDSAQLTQVFMNIMINAEEALKSTGSAKINVDVQHDANWVRISIADNGLGIPEENLDSVFHPFFTTKKVGEGTGLGLSTCYSIITSHKGLIRVENNSSGGATFTVELPLVARSVKKQNTN